MTETYLQPSDVSPADARRVLRLLNWFETAEEIAEAVELPAERDVGLRVGQRILDRRAELGGFTSLEQVAAVPQVGPERFTEIVVTLRDKPPPPLSAGGFVSAADLAHEVRALRRKVDALEASAGLQRQITLHPVRENLFMGQPVSLIARVTDASGRPLANTAVTFVATWGRLLVSDGPPQASHTVSAHTRTDGTLRLTLLPPVIEDLWQIQQYSLESMLKALDPEAATPQDAREGFEQLVQQYPRDVNVHFRRAVDIYFRQFRGQLRELQNYRDALAAWNYFHATVTALVRVGERASAEASRVEALAATTVRMKDWLSPWMQVYGEANEKENPLQAALADIARGGGEAAALVEQVHSSVSKFVGRQQGLVGRLVASQVARKSMDDFLTNEALTPETRVAIFPALKVAARSLEAADVHVFDGMRQVRLDARQSLTARFNQLDGQLADVAGLTNRVDNVEAALDAKADFSEFNAFRRQTTDSLAAKIDQSTFNSFSTSVNRRLSELDRPGGGGGGIVRPSQ